MSNIWAEAAVEHQLINVKERDGSTPNYGQVIFKGDVRSNPQSRSPWTFRAKAEYAIGGYIDQDLFTEARVGYRSKKGIGLDLLARFSAKEAPWTFNNYFSQSVVWQNDLDKIKVLQVGGEFRWAKQELLIGGYYYILSDWAYFDENSRPAQSSDVENVIVAEIRKNFRWGVFNWENQVIAQWTPENILQFPKMWLKTSIYFKGPLFKGALLASLGIDVRYHLNNPAYGFNPLIGQFHLNPTEREYYPIVDAFLSLRIKTVRIMFKGNHLDPGALQSKLLSSLILIPPKSVDSVG